MLEAQVDRTKKTDLLNTHKTLKKETIRCDTLVKTDFRIRELGEGITLSFIFPNSEKRKLWRQTT